MHVLNMIRTQHDTYSTRKKVVPMTATFILAENLCHLSEKSNHNPVLFYLLWRIDMTILLEPKTQIKMT